MLFNSPVFLFAFLPLALGGYYLLGRRNGIHAIAWLMIFSLAFYMWWDWRNLPIFMFSALMNYTAARKMRSTNPQHTRKILWFAICLNLLILAYFKYALFLVSAIAPLLNIPAPTSIWGWGLPLGISFFTFTQLAFLIDVYRNRAEERSLIHYLLFVSFFPHLIAGPILHHAQMVPQFHKAYVARINTQHLALGLTLFAIGLAKKSLLADSFSEYSTPVFEIAKSGIIPSFVESWTAALCYSLQLYFDFSGYSDMAVGLGLMFNIKMPKNFHSPYKASGIIEFWRRWHITLSHFLRDYLYIPLGGNRYGTIRRHANLLITMFLGGLWHGAGWTFVVWGILHGILLSMNHAWRRFLALTKLTAFFQSKPMYGMQVLLTFIVVVVLWVIFRAHDLPTAWRMIQGMSDIQAITLPHQFAFAADFLKHLGIKTGNATPTTMIALMQAWAILFLGLFIVWALPNPYQWLRDYQVTCDTDTRDIAPDNPMLRWQPHRYNAWLVGILLGLALLALTRTSEFLYFQF